MNYEIEIRRKAGKKISEGWFKKIIERTLKKVGVKNADISVAFVGDKEMKKWNSLYRGKKKVTDVLSFLYQEKPIAGEIIICYPRAAKQAKEHGWAAEDEIKLLLVHGSLHLAGYDHEKNEREAEEMEKLQEKILKFLK